MTLVGITVDSQFLVSVNILKQYLFQLQTGFPEVPLEKTFTDLCLLPEAFAFKLLEDSFAFAQNL